MVANIITEKLSTPEVAYYGQQACSLPLCIYKYDIALCSCVMKPLNIIIYGTLWDEVYLGIYVNERDDTWCLTWIDVVILPSCYCITLWDIAIWYRSANACSFSWACSTKFFPAAVLYTILTHLYRCKCTCTCKLTDDWCWTGPSLINVVITCTMWVYYHLHTCTGGSFSVIGCKTGNEMELISTWVSWEERFQRPIRLSNFGASRIAFD